MAQVMYAHKIGIMKYPLWRDLLTSSGTLLEMLLQGLSEHESAAYSVAEYMVAVVAPSDKRAAKKEARKAA